MLQKLLADKGQDVSDEEILAYFEKRIEDLPDGIVIAEMAAELGFSGGSPLGRRIAALRKKLNEDHFIHKIKRKTKSIEGKNVYVYRFE